MTGLATDPIVALGDRALRFPLPDRVDRRALLAALRGRAEIADVVLAEEVGAVIFSEGTTEEAARAALAVAFAPTPASVAAPAPRHHVVRVAYDGDDLGELAHRLRVTPEEVVAMHAGRDYDVAMVGFLPGFAYLRGLDPRLVVPRRAAPRARVPAGSVALAAGYTGIYPFASPGGWHLLGQVVDRRRAFDARGAAFAVGDRVRFERAERTAAANDDGDVAEVARSEPPAVHLEVRRAAGLALVVDRGRIGHMHEGVPHGGPMVPEAFRNANGAAGNEAGAAAIEVFGVLEVVARGGSVVVGDDARRRTVLADGEAFVIGTEGRARVRYLAIGGGGVDVPVVLGGRGTLLIAGLGGLEGRRLVRGDRIAGASADANANANANADANADADADANANANADAVEVVWGPDRDERVSDAIVRATFVVGAASDRTGTRLEGPALPSHCMQSARDRKSMPMVCGAIEITPSGLVVLGPDHPTTGGYPVVGVVRSTSIGRLFRRPIGSRVSLVSSSMK